MEQLGISGELEAKLDVLQIALATLVNQLEKKERANFVEQFQQAVQRAEKLIRDEADPQAGRETRAPHARTLLKLVAK